MKVKLIRLESDHRNLRTDEVIGECDFLPILGMNFIMTSEPLDKSSGATCRLIQTSQIMLVHRDNNTIDFNTQNSMYRLEILDEQDVQ